MAIFTLQEARALLPQVKEVTQHYYDVVEEMREQLETLDESRDVKRLEGLMNDAVGEWVEAVRNLGVEVKGLWLADFDSGDGYYYCWKLGEDDIEHFHRYETGFAGRRAEIHITATRTPGNFLRTKYAPISARHAAEEMRPSRIAVSCP